MKIILIVENIGLWCSNFDKMLQPLDCRACQESYLFSIDNFNNQLKSIVNSFNTLKQNIITQINNVNNNDNNNINQMNNNMNQMYNNFNMNQMYNCVSQMYNYIMGQISNKPA